MGAACSCGWKSSRRVSSTEASNSSIQPAPIPDDIPSDPPLPSPSKSISDGFRSPLWSGSNNENFASLGAAINRWKKTRESNITTIVNESDGKIAIFEKHREVWGRELYRIEQGGRAVVTPNLMAGTFVWMEIVWGDEDRPVVPPMRIQSDELPAYREFVIQGNGGQLCLHRFAAAR